MKHTIRIAAILTAATLVLAGCGGGDEPSPSSKVPASAEFNDADVEFATDMVPHHAQALVMVDMTRGRGRDLDPEFEQLAQQILDAQGPEIEEMTGWLRDWDQPIPETSRDHANSEDDSMGMDDMGDLPGMMSGAELDDLENADLSSFEDMWLTMMISHHEGAIEMAQTEQQDGEFPDAIALAEGIESAQEAEIEQMQAMLDQ